MGGLAFLSFTPWVAVHGVTITLVPWLLDSSELIYGRRSRPVPGQQRAGRPLALYGEQRARSERRAQRPAGPPDAEADPAPV